MTCREGTKTIDIASRRWAHGSPRPSEKIQAVICQVGTVKFLGGVISGNLPLLE